MKKLTSKDLLSLEDYDKKRENIKSNLIKQKQYRSVSIGDNIILLFENFETIKYQIQEMLRIEKIFKKNEIDEEINANQALIPDGDNFKATMLIMYPDVSIRRKMLEKLNGIENTMYLSIDESKKIYAKSDEDLERANEKKTSAVHFLRFQLNSSEVGQFKKAKKVEFGTNHNDYLIKSVISPETRESLASDLD